MKVITVDLGNTNPHFALFENGVNTSPRPLSEISELDFDERTPVVISSVRQQIPKVLEGLNLIEIPAVKAMKFIDMPANYSASIGEDRISQAYYLYKTMDEELITLIDIGTFITVDTISKQNGFEGGYIFPGVKTFLDSYSQGSKLPVLNKTQVLWEQDIQLPHNTYEAIGEACKLYLKSIFSQAIKGHTVLTGGDTPLARSFMPKLSCSEAPELIHHALYYIFKQLNS